MSANPGKLSKSGSPAGQVGSEAGGLSSMTVVTISRQMGSLGYEVGKELANRLGYRLMWRELINQAALRSGSPEVALATIDELGLLGLCPSRKDCKSYLKALKQVIVELADEGDVVIVGRAGQAILHNRPDVLHVRVIAPRSLRAERIARLHDISLEGALAQIDASDEYRRKYLRRFYRVRWDNPELYDLVLNTRKVTPDIAACLIQETLAKKV